MLTDPERQILGILALIAMFGIFSGIGVSVVLAALYHRAINRSDGMWLHQWAEVWMFAAWSGAVVIGVPWDALGVQLSLTPLERAVLFMAALVWKLISQLFRDKAWYLMWRQAADWRHITLRQAIKDLLMRH